MKHQSQNMSEGKMLWLYFCWSIVIGGAAVIVIGVLLKSNRVWMQQHMALVSLMLLPLSAVHLFVCRKRVFESDAPPVSVLLKWLAMTMVFILLGYLARTYLFTLSEDPLTVQKIRLVYSVISFAWTYLFTRFIIFGKTVGSVQMKE